VQGTRDDTGVDQGVRDEDAVPEGQDVPPRVRCEEDTVTVPGLYIEEEVSEDKACVYEVPGECAHETGTQSIPQNEE
jgi:hypothetical protein